MCGISALFSPASPQPLVAALRAMTDAVRHRGPDGEGFAVWRQDERPVFFAGPATGSDIYDAPLAARPERNAPPADQAFSLGLGHRRLAILDRSPAGHQPMMTQQGEALIVFNGEVYNHESVREELRRLGHTFVGRSDTEVILHAYLQWGADCLRHFNGMFSLVLFEPRSRRVFIARDR
jgi:asparagine synthase (glutamine-hydrolysing)